MTKFWEMLCGLAGGHLYSIYRTRIKGTNDEFSYQCLGCTKRVSVNPRVLEYEYERRGND